MVGVVGGVFLLVVVRDGGGSLCVVFLLGLQVCGSRSCMMLPEKQETMVNLDSVSFLALQSCLSIQDCISQFALSISGSII